MVIESGAVAFIALPDAKTDTLSTVAELAKAIVSNGKPSTEMKVPSLGVLIFIYLPFALEGTSKLTPARDTKMTESLKLVSFTRKTVEQHIRARAIMVALWRKSRNTLVTNAVERWATPDQKRRYLGQLATNSSGMGRPRRLRFVDRTPHSSHGPLRRSCVGRADPKSVRRV